MNKTVADLFPTRRDILQLGGYGLLGAFTDQALWPVRARAAGKANPRGTARFGIVIELAGAISHVDTFDFKESAGVPKDLDVRQVNSELYLSHRLFPELSKEMDKIAIIRSMKSQEAVHFRGQYRTQAGRPLNPAQAPEIPAVGSVIAYELEKQRRDTDTFPTYVGCNLDTSGCGALSTGFLHPRHSVLDINLKAGMGGIAIDGAALKVLEERYRLLGELEKVTAQGPEGRERSFGGFRSFQESAFGILRDPRWPQAFQLNGEDRTRFGDTEVGLGCLLARNLIAADAGTRFIHVVHADWDHHKNIFTHTAKSNHYKMCNEMDSAVANLIRDLNVTRSPRDASKSLLDETFIAVVSEFGRTPGPLNGVAGRHHYNQAYHALFAGAGAKGGRILGKTDATGEKVVDSGWRYKKMQTQVENVYATMYSSLGIDWKKELLDTPSKRAYRYVDVLGGSEFVLDDEIVELFV